MFYVKFLRFVFHSSFEFHVLAFAFCMLSHVLRLMSFCLRLGRLVQLNILLGFLTEWEGYIQSRGLEGV
jgi:hypothetical protein